MAERTAIDRIIEPSLRAVAQRKKGTFFYKSEVVAEVLGHRDLRKNLLDIQNRYGTKWRFDEIIRRYINQRIGVVLQQRDSNKVRVYECYGAGESERRWHPLRALTADTLRAVMRETRTQERQLNIKGAGYQYFLEELEKLGPGATVNDVYDQAVLKIVGGHSTGA